MSLAQAEFAYELIISETIPIPIFRDDANFDRACDLAHSHAVRLWHLDDDGHIPDSSLLTDAGSFERTTDTIVVKFLNYQRRGSAHLYRFHTRIERVVPDDDDE